MPQKYNYNFQIILHECEAKYLARKQGYKLPVFQENLIEQFRVAHNKEICHLYR
jgi:hypothetical protein